MSVLGAMKCLYVPLEMREARAERATKVDKLGVFGNKAHVEEKLTLAKALEAGRVVCRDIGGSDPERMASPRLGNIFRRPKKVFVVVMSSVFLGWRSMSVRPSRTPM